jgi:hypothetical protein
MEVTGRGGRITLKKREVRVNWKRKHKEVALSGELALEEAKNLS